MFWRTGQVADDALITTVSVEYAIFVLQSRVRIGDVDLLAVERGYTESGLSAPYRVDQTRRYGQASNGNLTSCRCQHQPG